MVVAKGEGVGDNATYREYVEGVGWWGVVGGWHNSYGWHAERAVDFFVILRCIDRDGCGCGERGGNTVEVLFFKS